MNYGYWMLCQPKTNGFQSEGAAPNWTGHGQQSL